MKKQIKINYILTLILVFCIGATIPTLIGLSLIHISSKDENMSSENGAAGLTQDQLLFTENIYASLPIRDV